MQIKKVIKQFLITKKAVPIICFCIICILCDAQTYIGKNKFGKLKIVNDSTCYLYFINNNAEPLINKCSFVKSNDTIFLSTKIPEPFKIIFLENEILNLYSNCVLTKIYHFSINEYFLTEGCFSFYDSAKKNSLFIISI
jgi:hypothetical protein